MWIIALSVFGAILELTGLLILARLLTKVPGWLKVPLFILGLPLFILWFLSVLPLLIRDFRNGVFDIGVMEDMSESDWDAVLEEDERIRKQKVALASTDPSSRLEARIEVLQEEIQRLAQVENSLPELVDRWTRDPAVGLACVALGTILAAAANIVGTF